MYFKKTCCSSCREFALLKWPSKLKVQKVHHIFHTQYKSPAATAIESLVGQNKTHKGNIKSNIQHASLNDIDFDGRGTAGDVTTGIHLGDDDQG